MTLQRRMELAQEVYDKCIETLTAKGKAYSGDVDTLANFKNLGQKLQLSKYQIWAVYFNKHIDSINNAIAENPNMPVDRSEGLSGRIIDAINYAIILETMLDEDTNNYAQQQ